MGIERIKTPKGKTIKIQYDSSIYSPLYSSRDTAWLASRHLRPDSKVIDVACGSGVSGIAIKKDYPKVVVDFSDVDDSAVAMTGENMIMNKVTGNVYKTDLLKGMGKYDIILTNLPTYDKDDMKNHKLYGPKSSYYADKKNGLLIYQKLIEQLPDHLNDGRYFIYECQQKYQAALGMYLIDKGYTLIEGTDTSFVFQKPTK